MEVSYTMAGKPIGEYLKEKGLITQEQLEMVLEKQRESNGQKRFGDVIVDLRRLLRGNSICSTLTSEI